MLADDFELLQSSTAWLNHTVINCCQTILRNQFEVNTGLFDTALGPTLAFPKADSFLQILHVNNNHWVLVHLAEGTKVIKVYDSLFHGVISKSLAQQCAALMRSASSELVFHVQHVQQQNNLNDCGPLALTFLVDILFGKDPTTILYDSDLLRQHLYCCLKDEKFTPCPSLQESYSHKLASTTLEFFIPIYCVCRMPYYVEDEQNPNLFMAECDQCRRWYHKSCVDIPDYVFKKRNKLWICPKC